ncbi:hypothetical protein MNBD_GAMMA22-1599 [hydrothermal vent metagenome]|uniref:Uncharacterized protein n=1 Tax=hydrothermal vent metagenome TaxID=652676 RepID=A0A3B1AXD0_9ZZZZ
MKNNDVLRRLRYIFDINDNKMIAIFGEANLKVTRAQISDWLKKEDNPEFKACNDNQLATFLNGFINDKRGKKDGPPVIAEKRLTNNMIFTKLKIALNLKAENVVAILAVADFQLSKSELSAFFRKPGHKHYVDCKDQILRLFLKGLELKYHQDKEKESDNASDSDELTPEKSGFKWKK